MRPGIFLAASTYRQAPSRFHPTIPTEAGEGGLEVSEWTVVAETKKMTYSVKMFDSMNVYQIDMNKVDVNAKELKRVKLDKPFAPITLN